jgi:hypothetical protein
MSRQAKIIIFSIVLVFAIYQKQTNNTTENYKPSISSSDRNSVSNSEQTDSDEALFDKYLPKDNTNTDVVKYPIPENGFSPYNAYFGKGIYNNSSGNTFKIKNSNNTDAVVLLVNAYSGKKVRNEFVRKGASFEMTGVPNGTYYLEWFSGNNWSPNYRVTSNIKGGFQTNSSFTKTRDASDWMKVSGYEIWTVTLYSVAGGDVESENINANEFFN